MKQEVIEAMTEVIRRGLPIGGVSSEIAQELLNLRYDCRECGGSGKGKIADYLCSTCKGTGKGSPMLAVLDENQELPECIAPLGIYDDGWHQTGYNEAQQDMLKAGWKKVREE